MSEVSYREISLSELLSLSNKMYQVSILRLASVGINMADITSESATSEAIMLWENKPMERFE